MIQTKHLLYIVRGTIYIHFNNNFLLLRGVGGGAGAGVGMGATSHTKGYLKKMQPKGIQEEALRVTRRLPLARAVNKAKVSRVWLRAP